MIAQCPDRPKVKQDGKKLILTFTDESYRQHSYEINMAQGWVMASEIMDIINESKQATNLHPIFAEVLKPWKS